MRLTPSRSQKKPLEACWRRSTNFFSSGVTHRAVKLRTSGRGVCQKFEIMTLWSEHYAIEARIIINIIDIIDTASFVFRFLSLAIIIESFLYAKLYRKYHVEIFQIVKNQREKRQDV